MVILSTEKNHNFYIKDFKRKVIKMEEYLFDPEDYFCHDDSLDDYECFSMSGYPAQDQYAEDPDVIYFSDYEYPF